MNIIIRDGHFAADDFAEQGGAFQDLESLPLRPHDFDNAALGIDVPNHVDPDQLAGYVATAAAFRIPFPSFADGRGFSIASRLRQLGFSGLLRAHGHVLCEQYPLAVRSGFDEVEISPELAERQPEPLWREAHGRIADNYLDRLRGGIVA